MSSPAHALTMKECSTKYQAKADGSAKDVKWNDFRAKFCGADAAAADKADEADACEHGLERIISKNRNRAYRIGRLGDLLKIKCIQSDGFANVGYEKSGSAFGQIGAIASGAQGRRARLCRRGRLGLDRCLVPLSSSKAYRIGCQTCYGTLPIIHLAGSIAS